MSAVYAGENVIVITGLPGQGKTLFALQMVDEIARATSRQVYTCGVNGISRDDWKVLDDGTQWHQCPPSSIILIDEGQRIFEPAGPGQKMGPHLAEMNTVRHKGILLVITTQHPHLLHMNVRKLTQRHFHIVRKFGWERADIYHWPMVADVGTRAALLSSCKQATRMMWAYPKSVYGWYKSAEIHTVQKKVPVKLYVACLAPFVIAGLLWIGWQAMHRVLQAPKNIASAAGDSVVSASGVPVQGQGVQASGGSHLTREAWIAAATPRIEGLPYTAPQYDEVTRPVRAPAPVACVQSQKQGCRCYTDQGTRIDTPEAMCKQIVERGFYVAWGERSSEPQGAQAAATSSAGTAPNVAPAERAAQLDGVTIIPAPPRWRDGSNGISGGKG